jgi:DNA repair protein RadD
LTGETPKKQREKILNDFKAGRIHCVANVGVLTTGFDYPELDTIVLGRPTRSLALYYQMVGRAIRPYPNKQGWIVDLCDTYSLFGKVENLEIRLEGNTKWAIWNKETNEQITNTYF